MSLYNQSERQLWRAILLAAGVTPGFNDTIRIMMVKFALSVGISQTEIYNDTERVLLLKIAKASGVTVHRDATQRRILRALADTGDTTIYNDTIRQLLLRLAGGGGSLGNVVLDAGGNVKINAGGNIVIPASA